MAKNFTLVSRTGTTLEIANTIGLVQIALLTALADHSPEVLVTMQEYLLTVQRRADKHKATDKQKGIIAGARALVASIPLIKRTE